MKKVTVEFTIPDDFDLNLDKIHQIVSRGADNWLFITGSGEVQFDVDWIFGEIPGILLTKKLK